MTKDWPNKDNRELLEVNGFIKNYKKLPNGKAFEIVGKNLPNKAGPDYIVKDIVNGDYFGIELTSVYLDDRSVPDVHMKDHDGPVEIPYEPDEIEKYKKHILEKIAKKVKKAAKYDKKFPLILSVYVNEYISIYMDREDYQSLFDENESLFDGMQPFSEIVFWPLPDEGVFSVRP
jgi:hypothetical protein